MCVGGGAVRALAQVGGGVCGSRGTESRASGGGGAGCGGSGTGVGADCVGVKQGCSGCSGTLHLHIWVVTPWCCNAGFGFAWRILPCGFYHVYLPCGPSAGRTVAYRKGA